MYVYIQWDGDGNFSPILVKSRYPLRPTPIDGYILSEVELHSDVFGTGGAKISMVVVPGSNGAPHASCRFVASFPENWDVSYYPKGE
jgi:hypothetical protein